MIGQLPTSQSAYTYDDVDGDVEDRSFLLPFGLENQEDKTKRNSYTLRKKMWIVIGAIAGGLALIALILGLGLSLAVAHRNSQPRALSCPKDLKLQSTDQVFFVVGDWGRSGSATQKRAAAMMAQVAHDCMKPAFVISTGDNFYPSGLRSGQDPQIKASFTNVYTDRTMQVPWYAVLGNHDYGDTISADVLADCKEPPNDLATCQGSCCFSPLWQVSSSNHSNLSKQDSRWTLEQGAYKKSFGAVDIIFIDTSPVLTKYHTAPWAALPGGVSQQNTDQQKALISGLLDSTATIKIVVGHHPVYSYGDHCTGTSSDCEEVSAWISPLLKKFKVLAYLSGHDHNLQYIKKDGDPVNYIVSGGGSDVRSGEKAAADGKLYEDQGFVSVLVRDNTLTFYYWMSSRSDAVVEGPFSPY